MRGPHASVACGLKRDPVLHYRDTHVVSVGVKCRAKGDQFSAEVGHGRQGIAEI
jgi:hypothetical protein